MWTLSSPRPLQLWYVIKYRAVLIIFPLIFETVKQTASTTRDFMCILYDTKNETTRKVNKLITIREK